MRTVNRASARRVRVTLGVLVTLGGVAVAAQPMLKRENAQAHAFVDEGERALAKGDPGAATLALERARFVAPRAGFVRTAIDAAQIHDAETLASRGVRLVTSEEWSWLATALGWVLGLSLATALLRKRVIATRGRIAATVAFLLAMGGVARSSETSAAVITSDGPVMIAPYAGAPVVAPIPAGTMVERGAEHGTFVRVRNQDGLEGWVEQTHLQSIAIRNQG